LARDSSCSSIRLRYLSNSQCLWYLCVFTRANRRRSCFVGVAWFPDFGLRHREPQVRGNLKAGVARVGRDSGSLIEHPLQANSQNSRDPFAPLLARKIREREIGHGISHRVGNVRADNDSAHPGYVCRFRCGDYLADENLNCRNWLVCFQRF
jgi:hypothetical protein